MLLRRNIVLVMCFGLLLASTSWASVPHWTWDPCGWLMGSPSFVQLEPVEPPCESELPKPGPVQEALCKSDLSRPGPGELNTSVVDPNGICWLVSSKLNTKGVEVVTVTALQIQQDGTVQILSGVIEGVGIDKMVTLRDPRRPHPSSVGNEPTPEQILAIEAQVAARVDIHDPMQVSPEHFGNQRVEDLPAGYGMPHVTLMSYGSVHCWNIGPNMTFCVGTNADGKAILIIIYCKNEEGKWYRCFYWSDDDEQSGVGN